MPGHKRGKRSAPAKAKGKGPEGSPYPSSDEADPVSGDSDATVPEDSPRQPKQLDPPLWPWPLWDAVDEEGGPRGAGARAEHGRRVVVAEELRLVGIIPEARFRPGRAALVQGGNWYRACIVCGVSPASWRAALELWRCLADEDNEDGSGFELRDAPVGVCSGCGLDLVWAEWVRLVPPGTAPLLSSVCVWVPGSPETSTPTTPTTTTTTTTTAVQGATTTILSNSETQSPGHRHHHHNPRAGDISSVLQAIGYYVE
jgi:hypothetical protein